ncbi:hypothetical protein [Leifsonia sp. fls2-241-R2A-40a]|uniref:hypothetical protein n=1 Tax=Leifsonia sp. fls2-241-R2A-40a TaxID=3040290 RepID=UPI00254B3E44|nr:hypothetical protein [Leifsonia sp. fls2-241-R2A-40a]
MPAHVKEPTIYSIVRVGHTREEDAPYAHSIAVLEDGWVTDNGSGWKALIDARLKDVPAEDRTRALVIDTIKEIAARRLELVEVIDIDETAKAVR